MTYRDRASERVASNVEDVEAFREYIEISSPGTSENHYKLLKALDGQKIHSRVENAFIACWSAKDWFKKDLTDQHGEQLGKAFETAIHSYDACELVAYIANKTKHAAVERKNRYINKAPRLAKVTLIAINNSFEGRMKPFFGTKGDVVPAFEVAQTKCSINGEDFFGFDTVSVDVEIVDSDNNLVVMARPLIDRFVAILNIEFEIHMYNKIEQETYLRFWQAVGRPYPAASNGFPTTGHSPL